MQWRWMGDQVDQTPSRPVWILAKTALWLRIPEGVFQMLPLHRASPSIGSLRRLMASSGSLSNDTTRGLGIVYASLALQGVTWS